MKPNTVFRSILIVAALLLLTALPLGAHAQDNSTGGANFVFVNYIGQELNLDLDDVQYTIPGTNTAPEGGKLMLTLAPGQHKYAANVAGVTGSAGEFTLQPGRVVAKAARFEETAPVVKDGILIEKPKTYVYVFDFDPNAPATTPTPAIDTWQPSPAAPGSSSLVWINYLGDELTVDLNGQLYKVPPAGSNIPGRLQLNVDPGQYTYTASVPNGSINGQIDAVAGQVTGLNVSADPPKPQKLDVGDTYQLLPPVTLRLSQEDLTAQATSMETQAAPAPGAPAAVPTAAATPEPVAATPQPAAPGLLVKNYAGDTLTFTINNQTFTIANNTEQTLDLPPGEYTFTASTPSVATSGAVQLIANQSATLSIALDVPGGVLNVYHE